ncbi:hypothetical protein EV361DRAFT_985417 [Lentinula raphanica]|nr:hypothetical protein EV361DRAFT_985417 [Lentinula raphanica]
MPSSTGLPAHRNDIHVQVFGGRAGAPLPGLQPHATRDSSDGYGWYQSRIPGSEKNIWAPFTSKMDWELAHWAKLRGAGSTAFSDLLAIQDALYGNPDHCQYLCFAPERHYADADKTIRLYHDFNTGKWWWDTQKAVEADKPGATIIPVILSSDKTQITLFRNKSAYPVYQLIL